MRVQVQYMKDGEPGGRAYTYEGSEDLSVGDVVRCAGGQRAVVVALGSDYFGEVKTCEAMPDEPKHDVEPEAVPQNEWTQGAPGSDEALDAGCTCAVLDNGHGKGRGGDGEKYGWWITGGCPVHAPDRAAEFDDVPTVRP